MVAELFKIIGLALITTVGVLVVKQSKPEIAMLLGVAGSILVFMYVVDLLEDVIGLFDFIMQKTNLDSEVMILLLKMIGVGYIAEFSANLCADSGNSAVASKILLAGKLTIFVLAIPIITSLVELIVSIMP